MSRFDVFISHASEDKESIAKPLAVSLSEYGVRVWYDEFTLNPVAEMNRKVEGDVKRAEIVERTKVRLITKMNSS